MTYISRREHFQVTARDRVLSLGPKTLIMGILNVTPDSFFDGGVFADTKHAVERAWRIAEEGADILDIGGESTRPGSKGISEEEELSRIVPVLDALAGKYPLPISIDTSKAKVGQVALEKGVVLINDVTALAGDEELGKAAASCGAGVILMHMRGNPKSMQTLPPSADIVKEIEVWAKEAVERAQRLGVAREKIIIDPGIGFGKTIDQNLEIIRNLNRLARIGFPLLIGTSRKSFIGKLLGNPEADRVWGSAATVAASILFGAHVVRVHDIAAMRDTARVADALIDARGSA